MDTADALFANELDEVLARDAFSNRVVVGSSRTAFSTCEIGGTAQLLVVMSPEKFTLERSNYPVFALGYHVIKKG